MTKFRVSGVWKNNDNVITHYAFHTVGESFTSRASKKTKEEAIRLLETPSNSAATWIWSYGQSNWNIGENVEVVNRSTGKYLRSNPNDRTTDNLGHLIDYDWISQ